MSDALQTSVVRGPDGCVLQIFVRDPDLVGKRATLEIEQHAKVKRGSPVHHKQSLRRDSLTLQAGQNLLRLGGLLDEVFGYRGDKLDLEVTAHLEIDDGVLFDTRLAIDLTPQCRLPARSAVTAGHRTVHSPRDRFSLLANLRAIPAKARATVIWLMVVAVPVIAVNTLVGTRDQFVPESQVWFYDHVGEDGSESPLMKALMGSGAMGAALWLAIRRQLQKYLRFEARLPADTRVARGARCRAADMISGEAHVPLQQAVLRVVAYNREHGQYTAREKRGDKTHTVTKNFCENARGVVLYEQLLAYVPANVPLAGQIEGEVDFDPLFDTLYPPFMLGASHGLSLRLEVQLLHPDYVDHEIEFDPGPLPIDDFYARAPA